MYLNIGSPRFSLFRGKGRLDTVGWRDAVYVGRVPVWRGDRGFIALNLNGFVPPTRARIAH